jgi:hypothetical protein
MQKIPTACPLPGQRALKCRKKSFLDEPRDMIAAMRRNNGDAVFQHVEDDDKAFVEWRSAMHSVPTIRAERSDDVGTWSAVWPSPTRVQGSDCCRCKRSILSSDVA